MASGGIEQGKPPIEVGASQLDFDFIKLGVNDSVHVDGDLVLDGVLNVADSPDFGPGQYEIFSFTGNLTDNAAHAVTIAAVFCIPSTGNALVDGGTGADLPGPGAVSIRGTFQITP